MKREVVEIPKGTNVAYGCGRAPKKMGGGEYFFPVEYRVNSNGRLKKVAGILPEKPEHRFRTRHKCVMWLLDNGYRNTFEIGLDNCPVKFY